VRMQVICALNKGYNYKVTKVVEENLDMGH